MLRRLAPALLLALATPGAAALAAPAEAEQVAFYPAAADARADLDAALADAARSGRFAVVVFGADWCHDSVALAKVLTGEVFRAEFGGRFAVTFIDVGVPQTGNGRNLDLAARHGVDGFTGTPTMLVLDPQGRLVNTPDDARAWRNASTRSERAVRRYLREMAKPQG